MREQSTHAVSYAVRLIMSYVGVVAIALFCFYFSLLFRMRLLFCDLVQHMYYHVMDYSYVSLGGPSFRARFKLQK